MSHDATSSEMPLLREKTDRELRLDTIGWGLALAAGCRAIDILLDASSMASLVGQAVLVEWGTSRLGISWTGPKESTRTKDVAGRVGIGAAIGFGAAAAIFVTLLASRSVLVERVSSVEASVLAVGLSTAALYAWRDELLLHGVVLRALEGTHISAVARVVACGVTSAGAALGRSDATARSTFVAFLLGVVFGALWSPSSGEATTGGAWKAWAAHATLRWTSGTILAGGLVHSRLAEGTWAGGDAGIMGGSAAALTLAPLAVLALAWTARRISARAEKGG